MVRQYVGARYVTKVYENSIDPSSAEWEASVNYEPLTLVTYNNGSYLSKKTVPASVGNPADNPLYWTQTGFYNGQIAYLQQQINAIVSKTSKIITPDDFTGDTDAEKLQNALDSLIGIDGCLVINRSLDITDNIVINNDASTTATNTIHVIGVGVGTRINMNGFSIISGGVFRGGITFSNITFIGTGTLLNSNNLIRLYFNACRFESFAHVIVADYFLQQYRFMHCFFENNANILYGAAADIYVLDFTSCEFEHNDTIVDCAVSDLTIESMNFRNCVIEVTTNTAILLPTKTRNCVIESCYFESNPLSIDMSNITDGRYSKNIMITSNIFNFNVDPSHTGILIPASSTKLSDYVEQKMAVIKYNMAFGTVASSIITVSGTASNHGLWYEIDVLDMGYTINSDLYKTVHQYVPSYAQFTWTATQDYAAGSSVVLLTAADLIALTNTTALSQIIGVRNGGVACSIYRNPVSGNIEAYLHTSVTNGTSITFNVMYQN